MLMNLKIGYRGGSMNEIVVYAGEYKLSPGIKVFVKSAKENCPKAKIVVLYKDIGTDLLEFLKGESNVRLFSVEDQLKNYNIDYSLSPYTLKVICFYLFTKYFSQADNLYLCDFTDIWFTGDIFKHTPDKCTVFGEGELIQNCQTNSTWINICYNQDIYNLLKKYEIINGGSILGRKNLCLDLLCEMISESTNIISRIGNYQNIDQAILNKVVYFDRNRFEVDGFINEDLGFPRVINLAHGKKYHPGAQLENIKNYAYVIHQYDVNKDLMQELYAKYQ